MSHLIEILRSCRARSNFPLTTKTSIGKAKASILMTMEMTQPGEPSLSPSRKLDASLHDLSVPLHFRTTIVKFSHASIRSFLLKDRVAGQARTSKIKVGFGANNAELHITQVCLSLLSDRHSQQNFEVSSLSSYAAHNFGSHLHSLERSSCPKKAKAHSPALLLISQLESYFELVG